MASIADPPGMLRSSSKHIGVQGLHVRDRRRNVLGLADDLEAVLDLEQRAEGAADDRVIVGQDHPDPGGVVLPALHRASLRLGAPPR